MRSVKTVSLIAALTLAGAGCTDVAGPGGGEAEVQLMAVGDGESGGTLQSVSGSGEGTIRFRARVHARLSTGEWQELTRRGAEEARVQASGRAEAVLVTSARVREGTYDRIRVEFEEVEATDVSVQLTTGLLLTGSVRVQGESGNAGVVEQAATWNVRGSGTHRLTIDLNSSAWMNRARAESRTVSRAEFESAVRLRVQ